MNHDSIDAYIRLPFSNLLVAAQSLAIAAAPLTIGVGVFAGGLMGGLMVVQDFKLRKKQMFPLRRTALPLLLLLLRLLLLPLPLLQLCGRA